MEFGNKEAAQNEKSSDDYWNVNSASFQRKIPENAMVDCMIQILNHRKSISHIHKLILIILKMTFFL